VFEVRIHNRGGHGVVTAAELWPVAALDEGRHGNALRSDGSEPTSTPVAGLCRKPTPRSVWVHLAGVRQTPRIPLRVTSGRGHDTGARGEHVQDS